jgi:hypothetical protein
MIAHDDQAHDDEHDSDRPAPDDICPACSMRHNVATFLRVALTDGSEEWHWATGELRLAMNEALLSLDRMEAAVYSQEPDDEPHDETAAAALVRVVSLMDEMDAAVGHRDG